MSEPTATLSDMREELGALTAARDWLLLIDAAQAAHEVFPEAWEPSYYTARGLIESGRYEEAEHILQLAMDRFPRNKMLTVLYGQAGLRFPDREDGITRWKMLLGHMPKLAQLHLGLAYAYTADERMGDADHALADGLALIPGNAQLLAARAGLAWERQDWLSALQLWGLLLKLRPDRTDSYTFIVTALYKLDRHQEADEIAREGFQSDPEDMDLASACAMAAVARGDMPEAARRWRYLLAIAPDHIFGAIGLSRALQRQNDPDAAEAPLRDALRHHPDSDVLLIEYATLATAAARWTEAAGRWSEANLRCSPRLAIYLPYLDALENSGRFSEAEAIAREALANFPGEAALLVRRATYAARRGDHAEALSRWHDVERHAPGLDATRHGMHDAQSALSIERRTSFKQPSSASARPRLPEPLFAPQPESAPLPAPAALPTPKLPVIPPRPVMPERPLPPAPPPFTPPPAPPRVDQHEPAVAAAAAEPPPVSQPVSAPQRATPAAPTALDLLIGGGDTGALPGPAEPPPRRGLLRRLFGKS